MSLLRFQLVSPEKMLYADDVSMVTIPASKGEMGILPNHAPMVVTLIPGIINIYQEHTIEEKIFIGGGFANINEKGCQVMADEGIHVADIYPEEVEAHIEEVMHDLEADQEEDVRLSLEEHLSIERAKMELWKKLKKGN
ncbi:MAG: ATP synthase F1 subunit epsilon [Pseudomonadota bacterium]